MLTLPNFRNWIDSLLDFLLPESKEEKILRSITPEQFMSEAQKALPISINDAQALFSYQAPLVKSAIWLLKYRNSRKAAELLGEVMANFLEEWLCDLKTFENFSSPQIVPVPMSATRQMERGQNHTEVLCDQIMLHLPIGIANLDKSALRKIRDTESQAKTKNKTARLKNLSRCFEASAMVRGQNIILIDDVLTTGATATECRKTLLKAGAKKVMVLTAAH